MEAQGHPTGPEHDPAESKRIFETALLAGTILLENGAEIFRVEETMDRICRHYGESSGDFFVLSNGIFLTGDERGGRSFAKVKHIPVKGTQLLKVSEVNQLSREIEGGDIPIETAYARLQAIKQLPGKPRSAQIAAAAVGSACFCMLFGGSLPDGAAAFLAGGLLYAFVLSVGSHLSRILGNLCGGALATAACVLLYRLGLGEGLASMVIGAVIPLVPGVPFTNGIRDIVEGDYLSGTVRLLDALVVFVSAAIGMGMVFLLYAHLGGRWLL